MEHLTRKPIELERRDIPTTERRHKRRRIIAHLILVLTAMTFLGAGSAHADIREDIESILSDSSYQRTLPPSKKANKVTQPIRLEIGPVAEMLIWVFAAVAAILVVAFLADRISRTRWLTTFLGQEMTQSENALAKQSQNDGGPLSAFEEVERLAQAGRFGEAVHLLLLHCFEFLRTQIPTVRDAALTSRELLERAPLPARSRANLAFIVSAVEIGHFGGQKIRQSVYKKCLEGYRDIVASDLS